MLITAIITGLIALTGGILWLVTRVKDGYEGNFYGAILFWVFGVIWIISFLLSLNIQVSSTHLSGYIYSSDSAFGYTTAHIRFSQNAGTDEQPSFCVKSDSKAGKQIAELVGSGKKVQVNIPPYFYFSNNPFACGTTKMTIKQVQ